ncbi:MAG TPA: FAD-binding oxidoreductase [Nitriliruptorales bacterium]
MSDTVIDAAPRTYWTLTAGSTWGPLPDVPVPDRVEVLVVGGGLTGLATALHLARRGVDVHVVERDQVGAGASTRNGGMVLAGLKPPPAQLLATYGRDLGVRLYRASLDAIDHLEVFVRDEGIDCGFSRSGALWAACTRRDLAGLRDAQRVLADEFGHATFVIERDELGSELGSPAYVGGLVDPLSAGLHPGKLVAGLLERALAAGVRVHERTEVLGLQADGVGTHVTLRTSEGVRTVAAGEVVAATNGYTPPGLPSMRRRVIPIGSYIVVTRPLDDEVVHDLIPRGRMVFDSKRVLRYFRVLADGRLLFGGRASFREIDDDTAAVRLCRALTEVFPQVAGVAIEHRWSGKVAFTFDQLPHVGTVDGLHHALGYCGHGVGMSLFAARSLAALVCGETAELPFAEVAFPTRPYYRRRPWFLPIVGAWYGALDRVDSRRADR